MNNESNQFSNNQNLSEQQNLEQQSMTKVSELNKEEAMEDALSHTTQYNPFELKKQEVNTEVKTTSSKGGLVFIIILFIIMALFIILLPQISKLFGW